MRSIIGHLKFVVLAVAVLVGGIVAGSMFSGSDPGTVSKADAKVEVKANDSKSEEHPKASSEEASAQESDESRDGVVLFEPGQKREASVKHLTSLGDVRTIAQESDGAVVAK